MCLEYYDGPATREYRADWKWSVRRRADRKTRAFWKIVRVRKEKGRIKIVSEIQKWNKWKVGVNVSNRPARPLTSRERRSRIVNEGIHVYLGTRIPWASEKEILLRVTAEVDDLVGFDGDGELVFMRVRLSRKDRKATIDEAIRRGIV